MRSSQLLHLLALVAMGVTAAPLPSGSETGTTGLQVEAPDGRRVLSSEEDHTRGYTLCPTCKSAHRSDELLEDHQQKEHGYVGTEGKGRSSNPRAPTNRARPMSEEERLNRIARKVGH
ncbi:hypothetical protein PgNI_10105 [Pyricularia grisea]|uniref:C2H2-type domain-containing protein n=1 Tax=Pyricularia grisea TaxID=148305 RepID=A0A6P8AYP3_PYRGI|nr:hypothetical protein PgNI_10105 [Pyricularia grisea]TLD07391.1 hypothetical protein PgNI_10105 [Pyricularia grisea]